MNGYVILGVVCDIDNNSIAFSSINCRPRKHAIYRNNWFGMAQPAHILHLNLIPKQKYEFISFVVVRNFMNQKI